MKQHHMDSSLIWQVTLLLTCFPGVTDCQTTRPDVPRGSILRPFSLACFTDCFKVFPKKFGTLFSFWGMNAEVANMPLACLPVLCAQGSSVVDGAMPNSSSPLRLSPFSRPSTPFVYHAKVSISPEAICKRDSGRRIVLAHLYE